MKSRHEVERNGESRSLMARENEGKLKKGATILKTEARQMKTYGDEANNPINDYMSEEMNVPSREETRLTRGRTRRAWRGLSGIEGRAVVSSGRRGWRTA